MNEPTTKAGWHWPKLQMPDMRGWVIIGFFWLTWYILQMIRENPALLANASFMQLCTAITGSGGLLLIASFLFGGSKGAQENRDLTSKALDLAKPVASPTPPAE